MPRDTTSDALEQQTLAQRRLGPAERFRTACMMSQSLRELALARIRRSNPALDDSAALSELVAELYGVRRNP